MAAKSTFNSGPRPFKPGFSLGILQVELDQDPDEHFNPNRDDIGDWFQGTPEWVRRS